MPGMKKGSSMEKTKPQQYSISLLDLTLVITVTVKSS